MQDTKTTTLRFPDATITVITVDDGHRLDAPEVAFLETIAIVLRDVEHDTRRAGAFRTQARSAEPEPQLIDLVGGPKIDGFEVPIDWCRSMTTWVVCTRFDEANGHPAELLYSAWGPKAIGNTIRIERQRSGEYTVTKAVTAA